jgi:quercetin dioxygenase-like cupin family protein
MSLFSPDELGTLAALHALGLLDQAESQTLAAQPEGEALAAHYGQAAAALLEAPRPLPPPPALRARLLERLAGEGQPAAQAGDIAIGPGLLLVRGEKKPWEETGIPGIRRKTLYLDAAREYASNLVSMAAGSVYPRHWHAGLEELYMLSGEITVDGHRLGIGDYCRAEPGSVHEDVIAASDCLFIALASTRDEFCQQPA